MLEERARRAAEGIRRAVATAEIAHTSELDALERFDGYRRRKLRNQRIGAGIVAVGLTVFAVLFAVRALGPNGRSHPTRPGLPGGLILYGEWNSERQQAHWFTVHPDGGGVVDLGVVTTCADWFPDGRKILITNDAVFGPGSPLRPAVINPDGTGRRPLDAAKDPDLNLGCGDVSPSGSRIMLEGFGKPGVQGIYSVRTSDGGGLVRLTHGHDVVPRYSPDGARVIFLRTKAGVTPNGAGALFVANADGTDAHRIVPWGFAFLYYDWSPDGRWIAFERPYGQLYIVHPDGSGLHRVPVELPTGAGAINPSWSPDGTWIAFSLERNGKAGIYVVRPDGTGLKEVVHVPGAELNAPDWGRATDRSSPG